jgi:hypothetical protein
MSERIIADIQNSEQEIEALVLINTEEIVSDKLIYQVLSQLWGNLKSINSQRKQNLDNPVNIFLVVISHQLLLMLLHYCLCDQFATFRLPFIDDHFMIFSELNLVVLEGLSEAFVL